MSDSNNNVEIKNKKRLMLPLQATYTLNNTNGFADGVITVTVDLVNNSATDIVPFWADDNGKLDNYNSLYPIRITGETTVFEVGKCILIPKAASRLLLFSLNYNTGEITNDYYEIALPKGIYLKENFGNLTTEFQVISDVHISAERDNAFYIKMLERIVEISPESVGLFISGDVTNNGRISEYQKHKELHSSVKNATNYYMTIGNHEFYDGGQEAQKLIDERFASYARLPDRMAPKSQHYDFWLNGYHYIFLGNDGITKDILSATFKDETMVWLHKTLMSGRKMADLFFFFAIILFKERLQALQVSLKMELLQEFGVKMPII